MKTMIKWTICLLVSLALLTLCVIMGDAEIGFGAGFTTLLILAALPAALKGRF